MLALSARQTVLSRQLKLIKNRFPNANITVVCGFEATKLMNYCPSEITTIENENYETTNIARSIGIALRACKNDVLIVYGDLVFNKQCLSAIDISTSCVLASEDIMPNSDIGCVEVKGYVKNLMYDLDCKWAQMAFFKDKELKLLQDIVWNRNNDKMLGFEIINQIINSGGKIKAYSHPKMFAIDIDCLKDLERARAIV